MVTRAFWFAGVLAALVFGCSQGVVTVGPGPDAAAVSDVVTDGGHGERDTLAEPDLDGVADVSFAEDVVERVDAAPDTAAVPDTAPDTALGDAGVDAGPTWDAAAGPPSLFVTVNRIPAEMNGSLPYLGAEHPESAFRLRLPLSRFTVDVELRAAPGGAPVDPDSLALHATLEPTAGGEPVVIDWTGEAAFDGRWASLQVLAGDGLVPGELTITATAADLVGQYAPPASLLVDVDELPAWLDPFPTPDTWLVTFSRDLYHLEIVDNGDGTYDLDPGPEPWHPDGVPDFDEAFRALGLLSSNEETNAAVRRDLIESVRSQAYRIFLLEEDGSRGPDAVPIRFVFEGDPEAASLEGTLGVDYSGIAVGGDGGTSDIEGRFVGRADIDPNNQRANDNTKYHRGVYATQMVRLAIENALAMMLLREIFPLTGTPIGEYPGDESFWQEGFDPRDITDGRLRTRHELYRLVVEMFGRALSTTLCHEMAHSLGLVPPGAPPRGLFGGMDLPWTDSNPGGWHIDPPGLNVMQTGAVTNYLEAGASLPEFTALNLAYLRRRLIVDPGLRGRALLSLAQEHVRGQPQLGP